MKLAKNTKKLILVYSRSVSGDFRCLLYIYNLDEYEFSFGSSHTLTGEPLLLKECSCRYVLILLTLQNHHRDGIVGRGLKIQRTDIYWQELSFEIKSPPDICRSTSILENDNHPRRMNDCKVEKQVDNNDARVSMCEN
jgi:hypothetical protein